ncbi:MAG TPA: methyltransferase domain-containing protein [Verrucomicrobiae bacterium]|jgi:SAM-dependent methyltransferase|nr:methyltransferase domain-containing protein [Verrucomicrobiae bacterium]
MFLRHRSTQTEYFDLPDRTEMEVAAAFRDLNRVNSFFRFSHPFETELPKWLGEKKCERLEILDVGAGTGLLGKKLTEWARRQGWQWHFTNLDTNPLALKIGNQPDSVVGSALRLPFADCSFDLVVASQMTHHLTDEEIVTHWREAWRVTRDAIFICDLHRNALLYAVLWLTLHLMRANPTVMEDGLISVRRGFRLNEWRGLAARAEIPAASIWRYHGARIVLQARKKTGAKPGVVS